MQIKKHKRTSPQNKAQFETSKNKQNYTTYLLFIFNFLHITALKLIQCRIHYPDLPENIRIT